ncbi:MAG TPA: hypothetical protein VK306_15250 [Acidimicrobiales bacterium]|nr:hypothetical protein [Acidimicrobiales bacterium]
MLHSRFSDAQCGFKAVRADVARVLVPMVEDDAWFFDTELLVLAEHNGLRIHEVPVDWVDDPDSQVDVAGLLLNLAPLAVTAATVGILGLLGVTSRPWQLVGLTVANGAATLGRFVVLRRWVFRPRVGGGSTEGAVTDVAGVADSRTPAPPTAGTTAPTAA